MLRRFYEIQNHHSEQCRARFHERRYELELLGLSFSRERERQAARPRTAIFFPGQGVQKVGMLGPWLEAFPATATAITQEIDEIVGYKLSEVIQNGPNKTLNATPNAQPAIMATSILILRVLEREFGFTAAARADFTLGHSLGEFAALVAGGFVTFADSLYMVQRRAEVMHACTRRAMDEYGGGEYGMIAVVTEPQYLQPLIAAIHDFVGHSSTGAKSESAEDLPPIEQVLIANVNSKNQIVLSGKIERIKTLVAHVRQFLGHDPRAIPSPMATAIPAIACLGVIGRNNNPLHISIFPSYDPSTNSFAPIRTPLQFSLLLSSTLDVFELRARHGGSAVAAATAASMVGTLTGDLGLLHAVDERLAAYGFETNTGARFVAVVDMCGRRIDGAAAATLAADAAGGASGSSGGAKRPASAAAVMGLRDGEMKPVFKAMQNAYVKLLQNPFFDPDEHSPPNGLGGRKITSRNAQTAPVTARATQETMFASSGA
ncbi:hypothetical protein P8C59_004136 [Phyllachora maydis]|uniref:[acyl-carrier-protein] S-malonyltransferase n=1 Tax=Phyllachora maydis TaxID=1825666 RepID=A0AAD9MB07_9PEZI|nr:hypothetical protein P8C59_004136 [Phyllachora maydis]